MVQFAILTNLGTPYTVQNFKIKCENPSEISKILEQFRYENLKNVFWRSNKKLLKLKIQHRSFSFWKIQKYQKCQVWQTTEHKQ